RLSIWYTLLTVVFRCPSSPKQLTKDSPNVCEPYFQLRDFAVPHLQPYYDTYASPYVQQVQPYFDRVREQAYVPAAAFAQKHGAPRAAQIQKYATNEWKRSVRPQLDVARKHALKQYDSTLGPHVQKVQDAISPYYTNVKALATDFYELELLPAYKHTAPYAKKFYGQAHRFSVNTALPYARWGTDLTFTFVRRQIWPRIQVLYGENVEPQIFKITQRLGRYRDEKKIEAAVESAESSASSSSSSISSAASASSTVVASSPSAVASSVVAASPSMALTEEEPSAAEQFSQDLKVWEEHVSIAVREGLDHLRERIQEICDRQVETQTNGVGQALIVQMEEGSSSAFRSLKARVETVIEHLPEEPSESDISSAQDSINKEVKKAGQTIKQKAQNVRDWKQTFDQDITRLIEAAANSTLETIDNIRDLRLQEIGRRWASNAAITHRDWTKYNDLKKASSKGRDEVAALATSKELTEAKKGAHAIEERAMAIAEDAAKELARLKSVSQWKLEARDSSDDFDTKYAPAAAARVKQQVAEKMADAKEAISGASSAASQASSSVASIVSSVSAPSIVSEASSSIASVVSSVSAPSIVSEASSSIASVVSSASAPSIVSEASSSISSVAQQGSSSASSVASQVSESVSNASEQASKKVWGGAMAQAVPSERSIVLDDDIVDDEYTYSSKLQDILGKAGSQASQLTQAVQDAMKPAPTQGSVESVTSLASEQYERALSAASSVIFGTEQGVGESLSSVASDRYASAVSAASSAIYGEPIPATKSIASQVASVAASVTAGASSNMDSFQSSAGSIYTEAQSVYSNSIADPMQSVYTSSIADPVQSALSSISSIASSRLQEGLSSASAQFEHAKSAIGASPTPVQQGVLADAQRRYYEMVGYAYDRYSAFDEAIYGTSTGSAESIASAASTAIYGSETPWTEAAASQASQNWEMLVSKASEQVYGSPTPFFSQASEYASQATVAVVEQYAAVSALFDELVNGREPEFTESVWSRLQSAYSTGAPAIASSASSYAQDVYASASSFYESAFTPPPTVEALLDNVNEQINSAVDAVSAQIYGTTKGNMEQMTEAVGSAYNDAASRASEAVYGTTTGYAEAAQSQIADAASSAQQAISEALFGTPSATAAAASIYTSIASVASENRDAVVSKAVEQYEAATSAASSAIYGSEKGAFESAQSRLSVAMASASSRLAEFGETASKATDESVSKVVEAAQEAASSASSVAESVSARVRDEL
ncbi:uncharacterized protein M437DRAFT_37523, partial [Aureobasidium melanogenum CBS 110374]